MLLSIILSGILTPGELVDLLKSLGGDRQEQLRLDTVASTLGLTDPQIGIIAKSGGEAGELAGRLDTWGVRIVTFGGVDYPPLLKEISSPPPVLFVKGSLKGSGGRVVAIVGSRKPSMAGTRMATHLARELVGYGFSIVSGLARGIDTAAHKGALEAGGRTIAVLGCGIDVVYPRENQNLAEAISDSGAVVTEFLPGTMPLRQNFPKRNRIISGLSVGTVVVEAGASSGALITADMALQQNRCVLAVPGAPGYPQSKGPNRLLKEGARLVESVEDILDELLPQLESPPGAGKGGLIAQCLSRQEEDILGLLSGTPTHVDELTRAMHLPSRQILSILLSLEAEGLVSALPGKFYVKEQVL